MIKINSKQWCRTFMMLVRKPRPSTWYMIFSHLVETRHD